MPAGRQTRPYLILTLIAILWGSYPVFAKVALAHFPPYVLVVLRTSCWASASAGWFIWKPFCSTDHSQRRTYWLSSPKRVL